MIGVYDPVIKALTDEGVKYTELDGVQPNPRLSLVKKGIEICREEGIDFVLGVGGGSVIDSAKAIAFGVPYDGDVWDFFIGKARCEETLPTGCVLTLPGTGTETSLSSVITNENTGQKLSVDVDAIRCKFAILNPELTMTLPPFQTACGAFDAMSHIMERYFTDYTNVTVTDLQCEAAMKAIINLGRLLLEDPKNYDLRAEIMWVCKIAHDGSLGVGRLVDWHSHNMGHRISALTDLTHGASLAIIIPAWMKFVYKNHIERFYRFAVNVFNVDPTILSKELTALEGIKRLESFIKRIGLPTRFSEAEVDIALIPKMTAPFEGRKFGGGFQAFTKKDVDEIFELAQ
jgi:alcohol dehydrogenase YqhD (iron-dependent ADH family)